MATNWVQKPKKPLNWARLFRQENWLSHRLIFMARSEEKYLIFIYIIQQDELYMEEFTLSLKKPINHKFVVKNWVVNPELNCLSELGKPLNKQSLEPRLMHLLCFLAANQGTVLTRPQLTDELWPEVIVNENSLTRAISELRKELGRGHKTTGTFLQTISKKGYRLVPGIVVNLEKSQPGNGGFVSHLYRKLPRACQPVITTASLVFAIIVISNPFATSDSVSRSSASIPLIADQVIRSDEMIHSTLVSLSATYSPNPENPSFLSQKSVITPPILSEDGQTLAYIRYENNVSTVFLSTVKSIESALPVFSSENRLYNLNWSPLGNALLFASEPTTITTTLLKNREKTTDLLMLDLETLKTSVLIDGNPEQSTTAESKVKYT